MRINKLDGLRGMFGLMVVFHHYNQIFLPQSLSHVSLIKESYAFVDFFFVLSGFVIAYNYNKISSLIDFKSYIKKRFIRIYPLLFFSSLITLTYIFFSKFILLKIYPDLLQNQNPFNYSEHVIPFLDTLFLTNSTRILGDTNGLNYTSWSISSEMISYFAFGVATLFLKEKLRSIFFVVIIILSLSFLYFKGSLFLTGDYGFLRGFVGFFLGYFVWKISTINYKPNDNLELTIPIFLGILFHLLNTSVQSTIYHLLLGLICVPLFFSFSIIILLKSNGYITKILESRPIQFLGTISYSLYLNHSLIVNIIPKLFFKGFKLEQTEFNYFFVFFISLLFSIIFSFFTYRYIEKYFSDFLKSKLLIDK